MSERVHRGEKLQGAVIHSPVREKAGECGLLVSWKPGKAPEETTVKNCLVLGHWAKVQLFTEKR